MFDSWERELEPNAEKVNRHPGIKNLTNAKLWLLVSFLIKGFKASSIPLPNLRIYCQEAVCDYLANQYLEKSFTDQAVRDLLDEASGNSTPASHPTSPASLNLFEESPSEHIAVQSNAEVSLIPVSYTHLTLPTIYSV